MNAHILFQVFGQHTWELPFSTTLSPILMFLRFIQVNVWGTHSLELAKVWWELLLARERAGCSRGNVNKLHSGLVVTWNNELDYWGYFSHSMLLTTFRSKYGECRYSWISRVQETVCLQNVISIKGRFKPLVVTSFAVYKIGSGLGNDNQSVNLQYGSLNSSTLTWVVWAELRHVQVLGRMQKGECVKKWRKNSQEPFNTCP